MWKEERCQTNNLRTRGEGAKNKHKATRGKGIIKTDNTDGDNKEGQKSMKLKVRITEKIDQTKSCVYKNVNKIDKSLGRLTKNKREET